MADIKREITEQLGKINDNPWPIEVNVISWNGGIPKIDIRAWEDGNHDGKCGKGVSLTEQEARVLGRILKERYGL